MQKDQAPNEKLKRARKLRGWSQDELARQVSRLAAEMNYQGVALDISTISRWERGLNSPSLLYQQILCMLFEKNADELGFLPASTASELVEEKPSPLDLHPLETTPTDQQTIPTAQIHELNASGFIEQTYIPPSNQKAEIPASTSKTPSFLPRRRRLLLWLLAGMGLGGGAIVARGLFLNEKPSRSAPTILARRWPQLGPDLHKKSGNIRVVQWMLIARGMQVHVDGIFWTETETAIRHFQENAGLPTTGTLNDSTWERLILAAEMVGQKITARGSHVKALQEQLNAYGASPPLTVDGDFGKQTQDAIKQFQHSHHIPVTGQADLNTWCLLVGGSLSS